MCKSEHQCFLRNIWAELKLATDLVVQTGQSVDVRKKENNLRRESQSADEFARVSSAPNPQSDADQLEAAADQAIAACGGDAREAVKALIVANHYLETDLEKLKAAASMGYAEESLLRRPGRYRLIGNP
jgi:hypothetical protein